MSSRALYRGVNARMFEEQSGEIRPKNSGAPFARQPEFGKDEWGNCFWGDTPENAVVEHQRGQLGLPTSGVSTTPHFERARFYATQGGKTVDGLVFVIDSERCVEAGVSLYVVNDLVPQPSVREDDEVILVARDFGVLPTSIIIEIVRVFSG